MGRAFNIFNHGICPHKFKILNSKGGITMKIMDVWKKVKDVIINPPFGKPVKIVKKTAKKRGRKGKKSPRR